MGHTASLDTRNDSEFLICTERARLLLSPIGSCSETPSFDISKWQGLCMEVLS